MSLVLLVCEEEEVFMVTRSKELSLITKTLDSLFTWCSFYRVQTRPSQRQYDLVI